MSTDDPHVWLEELDSDRVRDWVRAENARSLAVLENDPRHDALLAEATEYLTHSERIPAIQLLGSSAYQLLQDRAHVRGLLQRINVSALGSDDQWEPVLDIDALCAAESASWVYRRIDALGPENRRAIVTLSAGGSDAEVHREFDLVRKAFVDEGFCTPACKSAVAWYNESTLLVAAATDADNTSSSGYARTVVAWRRGTPFAAARPIFEVPPTHMRVEPLTVRRGEQSHTLLVEQPTIFDYVLHYLADDFSVRPLNLPASFVYTAIHDGRILGTLRADHAGIKAGSIVAYALADRLQPDAAAEPELVFSPGPHQAHIPMAGLGVACTSRAVYFTVLDNVAGQLLRASRDDRGWSTQAMDMPANGAIRIVAGNDELDAVIARFEDFTTPPGLYLLPEGAAPRPLLSQPAAFDASGLETVQHFATSADGTRVPYFVVRPKTMALDGQARALIGAYGGFGMPLTPAYMGSFGAGQPFRTMLGNGGIYVCANIRGGGEYGPQWHAAGALRHKQRAFDDFHAVAEDLIARGYTRPSRLGIVGASNSGLLVGVAYTQRPDLYRAVLCGVPLLDMKRYHKLLAGPSWMGEYGDPDDPDMWALIKRYSPYHNLRPDQSYPTVFFTGSSKDDRVHPAHMRKQAARMAEQGHPYLYFEALEGGHAGGADLNQAARVQALRAVYLLRTLWDGADDEAEPARRVEDIPCPD